MSAIVFRCKYCNYALIQYNKTLFGAIIKITVPGTILHESKSRLDIISSDSEIDFVMYCCTTERINPFRYILWIGTALSYISSLFQTRKSGLESGVAQWIRTTALKVQISTLTFASAKVIHSAQLLLSFTFSTDVSLAEVCIKLAGKPYRLQKWRRM